MVTERPQQDPHRPDPNTPPGTQPDPDDPTRRRTENEPRDPIEPNRRGEPQAKRKTRLDPDSEGGSTIGRNQPGQSGSKDRERSGSTRSRKP